jgi:hypothetical protein
MELLKTISPNVTILHIGERPRYFVDTYKTQAKKWIIQGNFKNDEERDLHAINLCSHYLAIDFNSNQKRKSGTLKNIENCISNHKIDINAEIS